MNDVQAVMQAHQAHAKALAEANILNKAAVFDALPALRISTVTVSFDGEGDSGQIEDITALIDEKPEPVPCTSIQFQAVSWNGCEPTVSEMALEEGIRSLCYDCLSPRRPDTAD